MVGEDEVKSWLKASGHRSQDRRNANADVEVMVSSLETVDGCVFLRRSHSMKTTVLSPLFPSRVLAPDYVLSTPSHDTRHVHHAHDVENDAHAQWYSSTNSYSPQLPTDHLPHRSCSTRVVWRYTAASAVSSAVSYSVLHSSVNSLVLYLSPFLFLFLFPCLSLDPTANTS